jgi:large conductance mechanosensitive channel
MIGVRSVWQEFKDFAFKGNMLDLAVGVVIGAAFGDVIKSMVGNIIMPIATWPIRHFSKTPPTGAAGTPIDVIAFGMSILTFLIIAVAVFVIIVKIISPLMRRAVGPAEMTPTTKACPLCLSNIPIKASKCAFCTADLQTG